MRPRDRHSLIESMVGYSPRAGDEPWRDVAEAIFEVLGRLERQWLLDALADACTNGAKEMLDHLLEKGLPHTDGVAGRRWPHVWSALRQAGRATGQLRTARWELRRMREQLHAAGRRVEHLALAVRRREEQQRRRHDRRKLLCHLDHLSGAERLTWLAEHNEQILLYYPARYAAAEDADLQALTATAREALTRQTGEIRHGHWRGLHRRFIALSD